MIFSHRIDDDLMIGLLEIRHAEELSALIDANREYLRPWLPWVDASRSVEDTRTFIRNALQRFAENDGMTLGIWYHKAIVGVVSLHEINRMNSSTSIGYWLSHAYWGRGIMTKACRAVVDHAITTLGLHRVEIHCAVENTKSRAIPERLGFINEGRMREAEQVNERYLDIIIYSTLASDWKQK